MKLKVGMIQLLVEGGEPERNLERAKEYIEKAVEENPDIVLLPETMDLGWTHPCCLEEAEAIPGPRSNYMAEIAKENKIHICCGLTEREGDKIYNTAILIDDSGEIISKYRKINLLSGVEHPDFYQVGQTLNVVDTKWGKIGLNICADNYIDGLSIGHTLGRMGAQVILSPSSWTVDYSTIEGEDPYKEKWNKPYGILASYYDLVVLGSTSVGYIVGGPYEGKKMTGCSLGMSKEGVIAQGDFNEFSSDITWAEFEVPQRSIAGTDIGVDLEKRGYKFDENINN